MFATSLAIAALQTSQFFGTGVNPQALGSAHPRNAPYQAFRAKDGYFVLAAGNDRLWHSVCEIVDRPQWRDDPRFVTTALRAAHQSELKALLEEVFIGQPAAAWLGACRRVGIPCSPIQNYEQALSDPQAEHLELVCPLPLPEGGVSKTVGCPVRLNGEMLPVGSAVPQLGRLGAEAS
jgi:crotonobetainyl-CoA:carnitine CoA-transferase CaiB-like acyl-CoA transferase